MLSDSLQAMPPTQNVGNDVLVGQPFGRVLHQTSIEFLVIENLECDPGFYFTEYWRASMQAPNAFLKVSMVCCCCA